MLKKVILPAGSLPTGECCECSGLHPPTSAHFDGHVELTMFSARFLLGTQGLGVVWCPHFLGVSVGAGCKAPLGTLSAAVDLG